MKKYPLNVRREGERCGYCGTVVSRVIDRPGQTKCGKGHYMVDPDGPIVQSREKGMAARG